MKRNSNNALSNETTAASTVTPPPLPATDTATVATVEVVEPKKPKQFIVGTSEKGKQFIDDLCKELQIKGKTGKLIDLPSHVAVDILIEIATDHRFHKVEATPAIEASEGVEAVEATYNTLDRFEELALKYEQDRRADKPETAEDLQRTLEQIQAKLRAMGLKA